jgi:hypothetical protein
MEFLSFKFLDEGAVKSVRKFLAYGSGTIFFGSCIYTMIKNGGPMDPTQYSIIAGVFGFYFLKQLFQKENNENK